ncbi:chondroitin sulfate proteoglycan 4 [Diabrotica virgifera virgifera]|uniref:Chondroitin sulfate proteoglycan 4 n=2 Tax=Diabrotica virgifera virgifera TaxID=50390 RepID=A0ABM5JHJ7_DIAVI|nr:chondroitin sulfate proteoglycan 4 [Diabrotica virgifera virgifera]
MKNKALILCFLYFCFLKCRCVDQASFYGNSFIALPFKEARSSTDINFKFKTHLSSALIFLVAGNTDYCIVQLEKGRIKVNINLGSGEAEVVSPGNLKLNDLKWHEVSIERRDANLTLIIDKSHKVQKHLPGKFFELNIHYGLFIGDNKNRNNTDIFFGHLEKFRGCISELKYNGILVLDQARYRQSESIVQGITWNCAAEFDASVDQPISFIEDDSYVLISDKITNKKALNINFEVKTTKTNGLLFYNTGKKIKQDFLLIELSNESIISIIKINEKTTKLSSKNIKVSDGEWHKISVQMLPIVVELTIDETVFSEKNIHGSVFQMADTSFIGGLENSKRFRATQKGCSDSCDTSFKGCLRYLTISDVKKGIPDAQVTEGIMPGCLWHYPCLQNPCSNNGVCIQQGLDSFHCQCKEEFCVNLNYSEGYKVFSESSLATDLELLSVEPLQVLEGQSELLTTNNLHMILDYHKYGITDSGITFFVIGGPEHGSITLDIWPHDKNWFTFHDLVRDKVHYIHDGSEEKHDHLIMEVMFTTSDSFTLPEYLQGRFRFNFSVVVTPTNDPPVLDIADATVLRTVQGTKKFLSSDIFKVIDSDNTPDQLIYSILKCEDGYFENVNNPGTKISSFTQEEVNGGLILFYDKSSDKNTSYISMQVSDGLETSPVYRLRVAISPQYWRMERNTGLIVLHQSVSVITPYNLSFTSNVAIPDYLKYFSIVRKPAYGVVEVEKTGNSWEHSDYFTGNDLKQHRVRYRHTIANPDFDEFQFVTMDKTVIYTFRIIFARCSLQKSKLKTMLLMGEWEKQISTNDILFETKPTKPLTSIHYVIAEPPRYGYLFSAESKYKLKSCDVFTQEDIISHNVRYKLYQKPYSEVKDGFTFVAISSGCNNVTANLTIIYTPSKDNLTKLTVHLNNLEVDEGSPVAVDESHLSFQADFLSSVTFNITEKPKHGFLQKIDKDFRINGTNVFTTEDINSGSIYYVHDNSETRTDSFTFMALSSKGEIFQYVGQLNIKILLKNDNSPVRTVDKVFHVVVGGEKILTGKDLKYVDADLDTPQSQIIYTCRESSNGYFYNIANISTRVIEFSQDDLDNNRIIFKHKGPEFGKVRLWVTDGQFHLNGALEVQASAPFIHVNMKKKIIVEQGRIVAITSEHLSYATNLYAFDKDVIYEIINKPIFGKIVLSKTLKVVKNFTQDDINKGYVSYLNEHLGVNADEVGMKVTCKDAVNIAQLGIWILPSNYWEPLEIKTLNKISVEESTSVLITKKFLEVTQRNVPPSVITYYIVQMPEYGYITILSDVKNAEESVNILTFTQDLVNENKILYVQSTTNQTKDKIIFNITNGVVWNSNFQFNIEIIPERLFLGTSDLIVNEGGIGVLSSAQLFVLTDYYKSKVTSYSIKGNVEYGCIQVHKRCITSKSFSVKDIQAGAVQYLHDGTESTRDQLTVVGETDTKKTSVPITLNIIIFPVNDQKPKIVNNTGLTMWEGGFAYITNEMLAAVDDDKPKEILKYQVQTCWFGIVSLISNITAQLNTFTQDMIDEGLIVFRHYNGTGARFKFNVTDGLHTTKDCIFHIKTKPVEMKLINNPLPIFPLQKKFLTSKHLITVVSDPYRKIEYDVVKAPSLGRLMMESEKPGIFQVISTFSQEDLNTSKVFYEHTHQFSDLYANDSFVFNVRTHLAPKLLNQLFRIDISVSSGGLDAYMNIPKLYVDEGGTITIPLNMSGVVTFLESHAGLRSPIIHASALPPQHGQVYSQQNRNVTTFTQLQLESGQVYYEHDHSDTLGDNIYFSLYLIPGPITLCNVTVPIIVNPVNDQPFVLVTPAPSLVVVQGENRTITRHDLATEDADTPPEKLKYDVISGPSHGKLVLENISVTSFTQADIDNNKLYYVHNGSSLKDSFPFRIWDGKFRPQFNLFNVIVSPINISVKAGMVVNLLQGSYDIILSEQQFFINTNADKNKVEFSLKRPPKYGLLYKDNQANLTYFSYADLINGKIMYLQTDMSVSNDSFSVNGEIFSGGNSFGDCVEVVIRVKPFMHIHNLTTKAGETTRLTLNSLNASPLAKLTNGNPRYTIINHPKHGEVRKIIRSSGEKRNILDIAVSSFSHEDIQSGLIFFIVKETDVPKYSFLDRMVFILAANIVQPAVGELKIVVKSPLGNDIFSTLPGPSDPASHEGGLYLASPNMTKDYLLIVSMAVGIVILGIAVIVVIKCRSVDNHISKEEHCVQPIPLPRPPDRLMTSSPSLRESLPDEYAVEFTSEFPISFTTDVSADFAPVFTTDFTPEVSAEFTSDFSSDFTPLSIVPHCKVTPLAKIELESPHMFYPYGVDDQMDDWSEVLDEPEVPEPMPCPSNSSILLRKNQYWV